MADVTLADIPAQIALALSLASGSTGTDFNYLAATARTESSYQAEAKAPTSSAQGLFQFIEETWIRTIKDEGGRLGLSKYAAWIGKSAEGRYSVDTPAHRAEILKLRNNPKVSAMMAAAYARQNSNFVENAIGRKPTSDELYLAHFLGPADAVRMIQYRDNQPSFSAPDLFPAAAKANHAIFFSDDGPRSVGQAYDLLVARQHGGSNASAVADNGPYFDGNIDFGTWQPKVQKIYQMRAPAQSAVGGQQLASAAGPSLFDFFSSAKEEPVDAKAEAAPANGWGAEVDTGAAKPQLPYLAVADDYPSSLLGGAAPAAPAAPAAAPAARVKVASAARAMPVIDEPRLKIIHVPQQ